MTSVLLGRRSAIELSSHCYPASTLLLVPPLVSLRLVRPGADGASSRGNTEKKKRMRSPGIEPGPPAWQARILPLDQLRVKHQAKEGDVGETKRVKVENLLPLDSNQRPVG